MRGSSPTWGASTQTPRTTAVPKGTGDSEPRAVASRNVSCRPQHLRLGAREKTLSARPFLFSATWHLGCNRCRGHAFKAPRHHRCSADCRAGLCPHTGLAAESQRDSAETAFRDAREYTVRIRTQI